MNDRRGRVLPSLPVLALLASATPARAAEGGLVIVPDGPLLLLLLAAFALLVFPANALLFRPIFRVLDAREQRIAGTRRHAERVAREADAVVTRYESAIEQARDGAARERAEKLEAARRDGASSTAQARELADRQLEAARRDLERTTAEVRGALRTEAEALARDAASRLLGRTL